MVPHGCQAIYVMCCRYATLADLWDEHGRTLGTKVVYPHCFVQTSCMVLKPFQFELITLVCSERFANMSHVEWWPNPRFDEQLHVYHFVGSSRFEDAESLAIPLHRRGIWGLLYKGPPGRVLDKIVSAWVSVIQIGSWQAYRRSIHYIQP